MVAKLPNSISFENRILKLTNEPEKGTYRYTNTETKNIKSITFQNFQKLFIENDMTWTSKTNEWVYRLCTTFDYGVSLDDKTPHYFEQIRRRGLK